MGPIRKIQIGLLHEHGGLCRTDEERRVGRRRTRRRRRTVCDDRSLRFEVLMGGKFEWDVAVVGRGGGEGRGDNSKYMY